MPIGYTHSISEGISFEQFTLNCAMAFGALVSMRNDSNDAPIPTEIKPSDYNSKQLKMYESRLEDLERMTLKQAEARCKNDHDKAIKSYSEVEEKDAQLLVKYEIMLSKVKKWEPPTQKHTGLKKFMIEQIESSIKRDCSRDRKPPVKQSAKEWLLAEKESAIWSINYHTKAHKEEVERATERIKWIQDLFKSLNIQP